MTITTNHALVATPATRFFAAAAATRQRPYQARRAYFLENRSAAEVAARLGYAHAALRSLAHQFRHDRALRAGFVQVPRPGPRQAPARDRVRELAVAMRKQHLSVYDLQRPFAPAPRRRTATRGPTRGRCRGRPPRLELRPPRAFATPPLFL